MRMVSGTIVLRMKGTFISARLKQNNMEGQEILLERHKFLRHELTAAKDTARALVLSRVPSHYEMAIDFEDHVNA